MAGLAAYGTTIADGTGVLANVTSISGPGITLDTADVTAHDSADAWEEHVPTILRSGDVSLDINYDPADVTHGRILTALTTRAEIAWTLGGPVGAWTFAGYVTGFEPSAPHDGAITASVTIKPTGEVNTP